MFEIDQQFHDETAPVLHQILTGPMQPHIQIDLFAIATEGLFDDILCESRAEARVPFCQKAMRQKHAPTNLDGLNQF